MTNIASGQRVGGEKGEGSGDTSPQGSGLHLHPAPPPHPLPAPPPTPTPPELAYCGRANLSLRPSCLLSVILTLGP